MADYLYPFTQADGNATGWTLNGFPYTVLQVVGNRVECPTTGIYIGFAPNSENVLAGGGSWGATVNSDDFAAGIWCLNSSGNGYYINYNTTSGALRFATAVGYSVGTALITADAYNADSTTLKLDVDCDGAGNFSFYVNDVLAGTASNTTYTSNDRFLITAQRASGSAWLDDAYVKSTRYVPPARSEPVGRRRRMRQNPAMWRKAA